MGSKITHVNVNSKGEWGEFFVAEREPVTDSTGRTRYAATWTAYTSYGVFGHHWYSMGEPFAEFIRETEPEYVLSKVGRKVTDDAMVYREVRRLIREARREKEITKEQASEAVDAVKKIEDDGPSPEVACHLLYMSPEINCFHIEWCDIRTQDWDHASKRFVEELWPEFVREFAAQSAVPT